MAVFVKKDAQLADVDELDFSLGVFDEQAVSFACPICGKRITAFRRKNELAKARCLGCAAECRYQEKSRRHIVVDAFLNSLR